ncbi:hypothetical protein BC937DRAFT_90696 [Endogone sp. FLAS-F59071]|nr:hypothetical protein BC937DRAFT_90696 [Endogone sp. FLAS-F59071]|eukprot:RUS16881.1 hypothetical protein BC937DRAFT_90696 [Endogone sp. FLAS-F59071]
MADVRSNKELVVAQTFVGAEKEKERKERGNVVYWVGSHNSLHIISVLRHIISGRTMLNTTAPESQPSTRSTPTSQPPSQSSNSASPTAESKRPKRQHPKGGDQPPSEHQRSPPRHNQGRDRQPGAPSDVSSPQRQHQRVNQKLPFRADPVPQHSPSSRTPTTPASASARDASKDAVRAVTNTPKSKSKRNSAYSSSQPPTYQHHAGDGAEDSMAPSKFITIADPIDPVRIVKGKSGAIEVVNGCDLYVDWVERSLKAFDQVVLIGIDPGTSYKRVIMPKLRVVVQLITSHYSNKLQQLPTSSRSLTYSNNPVWVVIMSP